MLKRLVRLLPYQRPHKPPQTLSHSDMLRHHLHQQATQLPFHPIFVESGCGASTLALADLARAFEATVYSCDVDADKVRALTQQHAALLQEVTFLVGHSLDSLRDLMTRHATIHFAFLDSASSAMHTFREFLLLEPVMPAGASVLIDNAALPNASFVRSPVRKGKILVPYLLAHPYWAVRAYPTAGDSMVAAVRHAEGRFADPAYESPAYVRDNPHLWQTLFPPEPP